MSMGASLISGERERQLSGEGWTGAHDDEYTHGELIDAAYCYLTPPEWRDEASLTPGGVPSAWPFSPERWKPTPEDRERELVKAGALIAAEIDRMRRVR
jgi:hypothetical protein